MYDALMIGLGVLVVAISVVLIRVYHHPRFKMTSWTSGTVIASSVRERRNEQERWEETSVLVRFSAAGRVCQVEKVIRGRHASRYPVGASVRVRYYPADPSVAEID